MCIRLHIYTPIHTYTYTQVHARHRHIHTCIHVQVRHLLISIAALTLAMGSIVTLTQIKTGKYLDCRVGSCNFKIPRALGSFWNWLRNASCVLLLAVYTTHQCDVPCQVKPARPTPAYSHSVDLCAVLAPMHALALVRAALTRGMHRWSTAH